METAARSFRDLVVWQKAHELVLAVYRASRDFPDDESFGLTSQIRRAAVSVPANIAEGFAKRGRPDKLRFLNLAGGSLAEVHYYLILASDLGYLKGPEMERLRDEVSRLLHRYAAAIRQSAMEYRLSDADVLVRCHDFPGVDANIVDAESGILTPDS